MVLEAFYPRGGWTRAVRYIGLRVNRLPDPPNKIARGIFAGVFITFTPFYGLHFILSMLLALVMRGNVIAALLATFFGNPLTYVPIGVISLNTGYWLLGLKGERDHDDAGLLQMFYYAGADLWHNTLTLFRGGQAHWHDLHVFYDEVFFPYLIGGLLPGLVAGSLAYQLSLPVITAFQNRRKGALKERIAALKQKKQAKSRGDYL